MFYQAIGTIIWKHSCDCFKRSLPQKRIGLIVPMNRVLSLRPDCVTNISVTETILTLETIMWKRGLIFRIFQGRMFPYPWAIWACAARNPSWKRVFTANAPDSYQVAFRRRKRGDAEDFGEIRGAQRVMGRTNTILCAPPKSDWVRVCERAASSGSWIKFNFFATRMSGTQSDCLFPMLEHAIVLVRATEFAEVENGLQRRVPSALGSKYSPQNYQWGELMSESYGSARRKINFSHFANE